MADLVYTHGSIENCLKPRLTRPAVMISCHTLAACRNPYRYFKRRSTVDESCCRKPTGCSIHISSVRGDCARAFVKSMCFECRLHSKPKINSIRTKIQETTGANKSQKDWPLICKSPRTHKRALNLRILPSGRRFFLKAQIVLRITALRGSLERDIGCDVLRSDSCVIFKVHGVYAKRLIWRR